ncbi:MAG: GNAT family N-acetyltransferase [Bdellovibrionales bacterium]|nr:GNAT family N-acetyltransferase [Bdellovibrionales bacterium]
MIEHYNGQYQEIGRIFHSAVIRTALDAYTEEQVQAWASSDRSPEVWKWRCELKRPFVCTRNGVAVGFGELDTDGHIDCLYTDPEHNRTGVGSELVSYMIQVATMNQLQHLFVEANHLAKVFWKAWLQGHQKKRSDLP